MDTWDSLYKQEQHSIISREDSIAGGILEVGIASILSREEKGEKSKDSRAGFRVSLHPYGSLRFQEGTG